MRHLPTDILKVAETPNHTGAHAEGQILAIVRIMSKESVLKARNPS
jgi:hypothetical protein